MTEPRDPPTSEPNDEDLAAISDLIQADEDDQAVYGWLVEEADSS